MGPASQLLGLVAVLCESKVKICGLFGQNLNLKTSPQVLDKHFHSFLAF